MNEEGKAIVGRFWEEVFNGGDYDLMEELLAPDYLLHDLANRRDFDRDELGEMFATVRTALPEVRAVVEEQLSAEGERVVTRFKFLVPRRSEEGQEDGEEWAEFAGISISRISAGKIAESWVSWEALRAEQETEDPPAQEWWWPPWKR